MVVLAPTAAQLLARGVDRPADGVGVGGLGWGQSTPISCGVFERGSRAVPDDCGEVASCDCPRSLVQVHCCFTSTETARTISIRDGEPG